MFSPSIADPHEKIGTPTHRSRRRNDLRRRHANVVELLDGIPGAHERAQLGLTQAKSGDTISLEEL